MATGKVRMPSAPPWRDERTRPPTSPAPSTPGPSEPPGWLLATVAGVVIVVVAAVAWWFVLARTGGQDGALAVGTCANGVVFDGSPVETVDAVDCADLHEVEVYAVTLVRGDAQWPGDLEVEARAARACRTAAAGELAALDPGWQLKYLRPTTAGWAAGDRSVTCFVTRSSGTMTAGSITR